MSLQTLEHRVPADSIVLRFKICENCGRDTKDCSDASKRLCCTCYEHLETAGKQVWECLGCGSGRAWGHGNPDHWRLIILKCLRCNEPTEHKFSHVA